MGKFERRHYVAIANLIKNNAWPTKPAMDLALMFEVDNPGFDAFRFFRESGYDNDDLAVLDQGWMRRD